MFVCLCLCFGGEPALLRSSHTYADGLLVHFYFFFSFDSYVHCDCVCLCV